MNKVSVALTCPSCGGPLLIREGDTHTACPSCLSSFLLPNAVRRYMLPSRMTGVDILRSVRRKLKSLNPDAVAKARVSKPVLYYVPFWHCSAQVNGYVLGVEPVYHEREIPVADGDSQSTGTYSVSITKKIKTRTGSSAVEREIQLACGVNISAANLEPLGIPTLSSDSQLSIQGLDIQRNTLPEGLRVLEEDNSVEGVFVDPLVSVADAHAQTEKYLVRLGSGAGFGLEERWEFSVVSAYRDALVYYPLWVTDFRLDGRYFQVVVDGRSGNVLRGRFPSSGRDRKIITVIAALLWAGIFPFIVDVIFSGKLNYRSMSGNQSTCLPILLLIVSGLAYGTFRLIKMLNRVTGSGSDNVVY